MEWQDNGIVLSTRKHGETSLIVSVLTAARGRCAGLVRGGAGSRKRGIFEPGNEINVTWRARLVEHLGHFSAELTANRSVAVIDRPGPLAALAASCAVCDAALAERESHPQLYDGLCGLLQDLAGPHWAAAYVRWEVLLLAELGFGLDLSLCAATGVRENLAFVSPKSGRAVSFAAAAPYAERLLPLPAFLLAPEGEAGADQASDQAADPVTDPRAIADGLRLTGYFLTHHVFHPLGHEAPPARARFVDRMSRITTISGDCRGESSP